MLRNTEDETEILLGNKQLLGIFLVVALLLGVAFTGGFLIGRGGGARKAAGAEAANGSTSAAGTKQTGNGGQTHTLEGDTAVPAAASGGADAEVAVGSRTPAERHEETGRGSEAVLGTHKRGSLPAASAVRAPVTESETRSPEPEADYVPRSGTQYLQVAAVGRDEAEAVSDVLRKRGFHAHAVPKPGNEKLFRVIIGPVKDAGDLSSTRDALRKTFREVIVQRY